MIKHTNVSHETCNDTQVIKNSTVVVNKEEIKPVLKAEKKKITPVVVEEINTEVKEEIDLSEWLKDDINE